MIDVLIGVPTAIAIAAISSWITAQLTLQKFRRERWWERKAEAYERVIEALHHSKEFTSFHRDAEYAGREVSEETDAELRAKSKAAHAEIRRATDVGAFFFCEKAINRLSRYRSEQSEASKTTQWIEYLENDWKATSPCLDDIIEIAKDDLRIRGKT